MNICLVSPVSAAAGGGTAAYIRHLGKQLVENGHRVSGVSRLHLDESRSLAYAESDAVDGRPPRRIELDGWQCEFVAPKRSLSPVLRRLLPLLTRPGLNQIAVAVSHAAYHRAVANSIPPDADIIHYIGTGWQLLGFTASVVARQRGIPFTVTPFVHPEVWGDSRVDIRFYNRSDAVWVCSGYEKTHLEKLGVTPGLLHHTTMAPAATVQGNAARFRLSHGLGNRPLILFLARKKRYKGFHTLREAMLAVLKAAPDTCLVAAGADGEQPYPPVPEANYLDLGELTPNPVDAQHKADALAACDVYCMPSTAEAFGIVYVEAWSYGKPVIGGSAPALRELILDDVNGFRVEQDHSRVADRLIQLLADASLSSRLGEAGRAWTEENCTWPAVMERHLDLWKTLQHQKRN